MVPPHPTSMRPATAPSDWPSNDLRVKPPGRNCMGLTDIFQSLQGRLEDLLHAVAIERTQDLPFGRQLPLPWEWYQNVLASGGVNS